MTYKCPSCGTLFTVHNVMGNKDENGIVHEHPVLKSIHCPNAWCTEGWVTLTPERVPEAIYTLDLFKKVTR